MVYYNRLPKTIINAVSDTFSWYGFVIYSTLIRRLEAPKQCEIIINYSTLNREQISRMYVNVRDTALSSIIKGETMIKCG